MGVPLGIMPYKLGLLAIEHTDEGYASVGHGELEEFLEHAVARYVIEGADTIDGVDGVVRVCLGEGGECVDYGFSA